jgi:DNA-binding NarL/FixJ family response regulator
MSDRNWRVDRGNGVASVSERTRVLVVDDHQVVREGMCALLSRQDDIEVVGAVGSVAEAIEQVAACAPHVVLMDYRLPGGDGPKATAVIRERHPEVAVVFLSGDEGEDALYSAVAAGAAGFLVKSETMSEVAEAVRRAAAGEMLIPPVVLTRLIQRQRQQALDERNRARLVEGLTSRELEILRLMAEGLDNQEIADRLYISYLTVRGHVRNILLKLESHTKLAAVARAVQYGLIDQTRT